MADEQEQKETKWWEGEGNEPMGFKVTDEELELALKKVWLEWVGEA